MYLMRFPKLLRTNRPVDYLKAMGVVTICTLICHLIRSFFVPTNLVMIYLLGVVFVATQYGRGPSMLASILSVAAFDFIFVPPHLTFAVSDTQYLLTFAVMLLVAIIISGLTVRIKEQAEAAYERERRTASLYEMSRQFASSRGIRNLTQAAVHHIGEIFDCQAAILMPDGTGKLEIQASTQRISVPDSEVRGMAHWVFEHGQMAGLTTNTLPGASGLYIPLRTSRGVTGTLVVFPVRPERFASADQLHLLETFANQTALALERARLAEETEQAHIEIEMERERNNLLSSISHDLRTPLASITGAVSSLLENDLTLDGANRRELAQLAYEESTRLNRQISNLLDMTRLEASTIHIHKEWQSIEEVIGAALHHLSEHLVDRPVQIRLPSDLPLVSCDSLLIGQVFNNLLENAAKYSPAGTPIEINAAFDADKLIIEVADHGSGVPAGDETNIFDKFYRAQPHAAHGIGLGLTICRSIIGAHGGRIWAENRTGGGAIFRFTLPIETAPPHVELDNDLST